VILNLNQYTDRSAEVYSLTELLKIDFLYECLVHDKDAWNEVTTQSQTFLGSSAAFGNSEAIAGDKLMFLDKPLGTDIFTKNNPYELRHIFLLSLQGGIPKLFGRSKHAFLWDILPAAA